MLKAQPSKQFIYVAGPATYHGTIRLDELVDQDVTIIGGFKSDFSETCVPSTTQYLVNIVGDHGQPGIEIHDFRHVTLDSFDVSSGVASHPHDSLYGIFAVDERDAGSSLEVSNVGVVSQRGGDGEDGVVGADGGPGQPVGGGIGLCPSSDGADGGPGAPGTPGTVGTFGPNGYQPQPGGAGGVGLAGHNGTPGGLGASFRCGAMQGSSCVPLAFTEDGGVGYNGCGGGGGLGGTAGMGGGASIAVYVWGSVQATITNATLAGGDVSQGGKGLVGGSGGVGSVGALGDSALDCPQGYYPGCTVSSGDPNAGGGDAGGTGGTGGMGGQGGDGFLGPSCALVTGAVVQSTLSNTTCSQAGNQPAAVCNGASGKVGCL